MSTAREIRAEAMRRLDEISDHGCEAASARAFEEGRLAALDALELGASPMPSAVDDAVIKMCRQELDAALSTGKLRGGVDDEPIVHRDDAQTR